MNPFVGRFRPVAPGDGIAMILREALVSRLCRRHFNGQGENAISSYFVSICVTLPYKGGSTRKIRSE
jgi:hypothetical protein